MTPDKVKRAARLLKCRDGLQDPLTVPDYDPPEDGQGGLALYEEVSEAGASGGAQVYLPDDLVRHLTRLAIQLIQTELTEMGVELPDKPDG